MQTLKVRIRGTSPLLMHNGQLADPLNKWAVDMRKVSGKKHKTEADHHELARLEYLGALYLLDGVPCIPAHVMEATIVNGAKKRKEGMLAKSGVYCTQDYPLIYDGPRDAKSLALTPEFTLTIGVVINRSRVMRTRPLFAKWEADVVIAYLPDIVDHDALMGWLKVAGEQVGMMDWRPRFGRFEVV